MSGFAGKPVKKEDVTGTKTPKEQPAPKNDGLTKK